MKIWKWIVGLFTLIGGALAIYEGIAVVVCLLILY